MNVLATLAGQNPAPMLRALLGSRPPQERRALLEALELVRRSDELAPPELPDWAREAIAAAADAHELSRELLTATAWELTRYRPDHSRESAELSGHGILAVPLLVLRELALEPAEVVADPAELARGDGDSRVCLSRCVHAGARAIAAACSRAGLVEGVTRYAEAAGHPPASNVALAILARSTCMAAARIPSAPLEALANDLAAR